MSKTHIVKLTIANNTSYDLKYDKDWFDTGRLADDVSWPKEIKNGTTSPVIKCYESDWSAVGCSGWVRYKISGIDDVALYFCFSNPTAGKNGIDLGTSKSAWENMNGHYDCPVKRTLKLQGDNIWLIAEIKSTEGDKNNASWDLKKYDSDKIVPANIEMNSAETAFKNISTKGTRQYYKCDDAPTLITGLGESHFKGVAAFDDKIIFTHSNIDIGADYGKYIIANKITCGSLATTDKTYSTAHKGWCHPGGEQACGSFLAMGIQESADGKKESEIQIYDIRKVPVNGKIELIATIKRTTEGINGVAMTKEKGDDGKYIVAGIQGSTVKIYKSNNASLLPKDLAKFDEEAIWSFDLKKSMPGIALVTQQDGTIYLFGFDGDDAGTYNKMYLYRLDIQKKKLYPVDNSPKDMPVPGMSDTVTYLKEYAAVITAASAGIGTILTTLLALGDGYLNSSFRWGKGLNIISADSIEVYATDRNSWPLSDIPAVGSDKDFSLVTWR